MNETGSGIRRKADQAEKGTSMIGYRPTVDHERKAALIMISPPFHFNIRKTCKPSPDDLIKKDTFPRRGSVRLLSLG
jgi:hypothetical protein